jgi:predicted DNA-binding antitoxin AbrB/MazE fold protein
MQRTIKARYSKGKIEPLEKLDIEEGKELIVTISDKLTEAKGKDPLDSTFGGWTELIDAEGLKKNIYADRAVSSRPKVTL